MATHAVPHEIKTFNSARVIDPTENVIALVKAETKRQDDLRSAAQLLSDVKHVHAADIADLHTRHLSEIGLLREAYQEKIQHAEAGRLDSIRQVDREEVAKTAVAANTAIQTLAKQTTDLQQTLAKQVTDTAAAQEARNSAQYSDINKRLSALELSSSEGRGKATVSDPQMDKLTTLVEALARIQDKGSGKAERTSDMSGWILSGIMTLLAIGGLAVAIFKP